MRVIFELNGNLRLRFEPQSELEAAFMRQMADLSEKGATTLLAAPERAGNEFVLEVQQQ